MQTKEKEPVSISRIQMYYLDAALLRGLESNASCSGILVFLFSLTDVIQLDFF